MTSPSEDLLATTEGVDEGSRESTAEGSRESTAEGSRESTAEGDPSTEKPTGVPDPVSKALGGGPGDVEAEPAPPVDMESDASRSARAARGPGQQLEAGEG